MYTQFYGFKEKPFKLVPDPRFLYLSEAHRAALNHLQYGLEDRNGFVVITGEVGSGKTLLLRVLMNSLPRTTRMARVINTNFNAHEMLEHVLNEFGLETGEETKPKLLSMLTQYLLKAFAERKAALLVIDEAQNLSLDALEELRMISNLETNTEKLIQIVMVGQPQLRYKLNLPDLEQLKQRITVQYHLPALSEADTYGYVKHRLQVSRGEVEGLFTDEALRGIYEYSHGIPRLINVIADAALRLGYAEEKSVVDGALVDDVSRELEEIGATDGPGPLPGAAATGALDQSIIELNRKFQSLYDQMQEIYIHKGEENRLAYERFLNREPEKETEESLHKLQEREQMILEKEREIHEKLFEVSRRLDELNVFRESLEEKKVEFHDKVRELDLRLEALQAPQGPDREKGADAAASDSGETLKRKMQQLEGVQERLQAREEDLNARMEELKSVLGDLEEKKEMLHSLEQDESVDVRLRELEQQQRSVRKKEEDLVSKLALLEKQIQQKAISPAPAVPGAADSLQEKQFLVDLIVRVDRLLSEMDAMESQKQLLHSWDGSDDGLEVRRRQIEQNFAILQEREEGLLEKIDQIKNSLKGFEDKTAALDVIAEGFVHKEQVLDRKLDELSRLILGMEQRRNAAEREKNAGATPVRQESPPPTAPEKHSELPDGGRRFNMLVRKILSES